MSSAQKDNLMTQDAISFDIDKARISEASIRKDIENIDAIMERIQYAINKSSSWWTGASNLAFKRKANGLITLQNTKLKKAITDIADNMDKAICTKIEQEKAGCDFINARSITIAPLKAQALSGLVSAEENKDAIKYKDLLTRVTIPIQTINDYEKKGFYFVREWSSGALFKNSETGEYKIWGLIEPVKNIRDGQGPPIPGFYFTKRNGEQIIIQTTPEEWEAQRLEYLQQKDPNKAMQYAVTPEKRLDITIRYFGLDK